MDDITKINFQKSSFVKSAPDLKSFLFDKPCVLFLGKSNVGKSSLINRLLNRNNFMRVSQTPGRTRMLNYILIDDNYYIVDAPGYGYYKKPTDFENMMLNFLKHANKNIKLCVLLIDSRRHISDDDVEVINLLIKHNLNYLVCYTKYDKLNQKEKSSLDKSINELNLSSLKTSSETNYNIDKLREILTQYLIAK